MCDCVCLHVCLNSIYIQFLNIIYIYIYIYVYVYIYARTHIYIYTHHTRINIYIYTCIHAYIHTFIHSYIHTYIHTYVCVGAHPFEQRQQNGSRISLYATFSGSSPKAFRSQERLGPSSLNKEGVRDFLKNDRCGWAGVLHKATTCNRQQVSRM